MLNDVLIFRRVKGGDIRAFETLFKRYYEPLCQYSRKYVGEMDEAEEIVQELFYKVWKGRENLKIVLSVKSYLYGAVRNNSLQYLEHVQVKQNYREREMIIQNEADFSAPDIQLEYKELQERLDKALNKLPERRRKIFTMNRFEGKKYNEIAELFDLSVKTIEAEITKALKELKKEMSRL